MGHCAPWINDAARPRGRVAYAQVVANQAGITTVVDLSGLTAGWTAEAGRSYKVTVQGFMFSSVNDDYGGLVIATSANVQVQSSQALLKIAGAISLQCSAVLTGLSGAVSYKARGVRAAGSGSLTLQAGASFPAFILVEDIGLT